MVNWGKDIRWKQLFSNYRKALVQLEEFVNKENLSRLEERGLIKAFEFTYELAWNVIKDYYQFQGIIEIHGSRDAFRTAFKEGLIEDGDTWMDMIESRIQTTHTYNESVAGEIARDGKTKYFPQFKDLESKLERISEN